MVFSPTGSSDLLVILGCNFTSNFLYLSFSTSYSSSFGRTDTIIFAKLNTTPPLTPRRGMIEDLWYFSWVMQEAPFVRILFACIPSSHFRLKQHICNTIMQSDNVVILLYFLKNAASDIDRRSAESDEARGVCLFSTFKPPHILPS